MAKLWRKLKWLVFFRTRCIHRVRKKEFTVFDKFGHIFVIFGPL